ncbi:Pathogenicity locus [Pseudomonas sp. GL93]|uniref:helix-hairpin-helix domain-containing protein n=1 Tax=Pseudomonas sp. GL93 TaxID=2014741 RepID=UPI000E3159B1|nr:helix-hairpin-helix domain-containing protein [Pseudomonas sp. GL93]RFD27585.1 Pathogenicity locus [Pseudomonas sp. GL93]
MPFSLEERTALLALKGVGPTVITRLEQMGIESMEELGKSQVEDILAQASAALGSTCWKNSPQARAAITTAVGLAKKRAKTSCPGNTSDIAQLQPV